MNGPAENGRASLKSDLLGRILASREFAHAQMLKRVLGYLVERGAGPVADTPKEYEIAVEAMGRPPGFDPRTDPIVRVSIASIRNRLLSYFATEGRSEPLRLTIPRGRYLPVFEDAPPSNGDAAAVPLMSALRRFWRTDGRAAAIVYTEPLFFRDDNGHYVRDWYTNEVEGEPRVRQWTQSEQVGRLVPSYHYLSAGEVHAMLSLSRMLQDLGVPAETRNSRRAVWKELRHLDLILLGSPRTNTFLSTLQGDEAFVIDAERILNRAPTGNECAEYQGKRYCDGHLTRMTEHAVVTRRPGMVPGRAVTMIAANHGRAIEGAGHFLTLEQNVRQVIGALGLGESEAMPPHFQLLMAVETMDIDDEVMETRCLATRILKERG